MEFDKEYPLNICSFEFCHHFKFCLNSAFALDGSVSGSSPATFLLAARIIEPQLSANLIASFLPLKNLLILAKVFFCFSDLFQLLFFRYLLNYSCLHCASFVHISHFLILSTKATGLFDSLKSVSRLILLTTNFKSP